MAVSVNSSAESFGCASLQLQHLFFAIPRLCIGFERMKKAAHYISDFVNGGLKRDFISLRRFVKAADLSDKLERSSSDFLIRYRWLKVEECLYISAHSL
jgi:hypothetical protein